MTKQSRMTNRPYKGVSFDSRSGKFKPYIDIDGKRKYLGTYATRQQAMDVHDAAAIEHHGPDAVTNAELQRLYAARVEEAQNSDEKWAIVEEFPKYSVSTHGNVKSNKSGHTLRSKPRGPGLCVALYNDDGHKSVSVHRLVAKAFIPNPNGCRFVDHINGDITNNHIDNLRWATHQENMRNTKKRRTAGRGVATTSKYKGVIWSYNRWVAQIKHSDGKVRRIGSFATERAAADAYDEAAVRLFGEFARTNAMIRAAARLSESKEEVEEEEMDEEEGEKEEDKDVIVLD